MNKKTYFLDVVFDLSLCRIYSLPHDDQYEPLERYLIFSSSLACSEIRNTSSYDFSFAMQLLRLTSGKFRD